MPTTSFSVRMDADVKKESELIYNALGVNLTTAINVFLRKSIAAGGFPFDVRIEEQPNRETIEAMLEAERIARDPNVKKYSVEEALQELKS
ncbi:MAG: type II toxin-antitoxin system RelB/DinJ family antitoxin [Synergistes sp.]|nr:type II toxin-antitoxin system RelB/DinJ family antitoxin [Synergistes sp.]